MLLLELVDELELVVLVVVLELVDRPAEIGVVMIIGVGLFLGIEIANGSDQLVSS